MDYSDEGRKLLASLGVTPGRSVAGYNSMDLIWSDAKTGGKVYVGNETAARMADQHPERITHVVARAWRIEPETFASRCLCSLP